MHTPIRLSFIIVTVEHAYASTKWLKIHRLEESLRAYEFTFTFKDFIALQY